MSPIEVSVKELVQKFNTVVAKFDVQTVALVVENPDDLMLIEKECEKRHISRIMLSKREKTAVIKRSEGAVGAEFEFYITGGRCRISQLIVHHKKSDQAHLFFLTSGSTGIPKIVKKSKKQVILEGRQLLQLINVPNKTIFSNLLPTHYFGYIYEIIFPLVFGYRLKWKSPEIPLDHFDFSKNSNGLVVTTPWHEKLLANSSSLPQAIVTAGSAPSLQIVEKLILSGTTVYDQFGTTETGVIFVNKMKSGGQVKTFLIQGVTMKDQNGKTKVTSPIISKSYVGENGSESLISGLINDQFRHKDGNIYFKGRSDDVIVQNGNKYNPEVIESKINSFGSVICSRVFQRGNSIHADVQFAKHVKGNEMSLATWLNKGPIGMPVVQIHEVEELMLSNGKVERRN